MSIEANKTILRRYVEELNQRNLAILDELVAEDVQIGAWEEWGQPAAEIKYGSVAYGEGIRQRIAAFPDYQVTILEMIAEADQVMLYWRNRGTQLGIYDDVPPTGQVLEEVHISIYRIRNGQIVEVR